MVKVYSARDGLEAHFIRNLLEGEGIRAAVLGETLAFGRGDLPMTQETLPGVWVNPEDEQIARDAGATSVATWVGQADVVAARERVVAEVNRLMDGDVKATGLKELQGLIWRQGYESGALCSHVYEDVPRALATWTKAGRLVRIYSSGSAAAQRLFFGHSDDGDLTTLVSGWFDTEVGGKREADSYRRIVEAIGYAADEVLFLSDVVEELDAAREAGLGTVLLDRREDYAQPRHGEATHGHARAESFADVALAG